MLFSDNMDGVSHNDKRRFGHEGQMDCGLGGNRIHNQRGNARRACGCLRSGRTRCRFLDFRIMAGYGYRIGTVQSLRHIRLQRLRHDGRLRRIHRSVQTLTVKAFDFTMLANCAKFRF